MGLATAVSSIESIVGSNPSANSTENDFNSIVTINGASERENNFPIQFRCPMEKGMYE